MFLEMIWLLASTQTVGTEMVVEDAAAPSNAFDIFKEVCFSKFPDPDAAASAIAAHPAAFEKVEKTGPAAQQLGDTWTSGDIKIFYASADWLPRDLPSPQCGVSVPLKSDQSHRELATEFMSDFDLPEGKIGKDKPRSSSRWDMQGEGKDKWRIFLATESNQEGDLLSIRILNLRAK